MTDWIKAVRTHELVDVSQIKKSYLISELSKAVKERDERMSFEPKLKDFLDNLESSELDGLTKLISSDYRDNAVYRKLEKYPKWYKCEVHIDHIYLTETNPKEQVGLEKLEWNLGKLVRKIRTTEAEDLEKVGLGDFLGKGDLSRELPIAIYRNENENPRIEFTDGMHRTPSSFSRNEDEYLTHYLGRND